jgi:hypothetical protein
MGSNKKRVTIKIMENVTDQELDTLVKGRKKIQGFDFSIDTFVVINKEVIRR